MVSLALLPLIISLIINSKSFNARSFNDNKNIPTKTHLHCSSFTPLSVNTSRWPPRRLLYVHCTCVCRFTLLCCSFPTNYYLWRSSKKISPTSIRVTEREPDNNQYNNATNPHLNVLYNRHPPTFLMRHAHNCCNFISDDDETQKHSLGGVVDVAAANVPIGYASHSSQSQSV